MGTPPEVVILDGDGNAVPERPPRRPARTWGIAALAAALFFVLGVVVGARHAPIGGAAVGADLVATPSASESAASAATSGAPIRPGKTVGALPGPVGPLPMTAWIERAEPLIPGSTDWELVGYADYGDDGVLVRFDDGGGKLITTRILAALRGATLTTADQGVVLNPPSDAVIVIRDGAAAETAGGDLSAGGIVLPGVDSAHLWIAPQRGGSYDRTFVEVDLGGVATGRSLTLPEAIPAVSTLTIGPDGVGGVLAQGWSGHYDVTLDGIRFVTSGVVLAVGPTGYLTWTCNDAGVCAAVYRDRDGGSQRTIPAAGWNPGTVNHGIISPDGRYAALYRLDQRGTVLTILDLADGTARSVVFTAASGDPGAQTMAFTPDSRSVMVVAGSGVVPVDLGRAEPLPPLPIPPLDAIVIRPAG